MSRRNFTGYQQVIKETTYDDQDAITKTIEYTIGLDEIAQTVTPYADGQPDAENAETHIFAYDGHGSVRVLTDLAAAAAVQFYAFDAYGQMLAIWNQSAQLISGGAGQYADPAAALTNLLYAGEQFDTRIGQQYLRARYYDPTTGRFNRLDPFFGNLHDPLSLHKYLYVHADPVNGADPTGLAGSFSLSGMIGFMAAGAVVGAVAFPAFGLGPWWQGALIGAGAGAFAYVGAPVVRIHTAVWVVFSTANIWYEARNRLNKSSSFGKGGYEADTILLKVRNAVINQWKALQRSQKEQVIDYMHDLRGGQAAWEIPELAWDKERWTRSLVGDIAEDTLTYKGRVYPTAEVNYLLWGLVNGLAYRDGVRSELTSIDGTLRKVVLYRGMAGGLVIGDQWWKGKVPRFETMSGKVAWAGYGWGWAWTDTPPPPIEESLPNARPNVSAWPHVMNFKAGPPLAHVICGIVQP